MLLADSAILHAIEREEITITPFDKARLGSNSYDLTLSKHILIYHSGVLDCKNPNPYDRRIIPESGTIISPGELILGSTVEFTGTDVYAPYIEGKSSIGRLGLSIHATAGVGDIGFHGHWTLEMSVIRNLRIYPGMPVCQIMFLSTQGACLNPYNKKAGAKYSGQPGKPVPSMMYRNFDSKAPENYGE